MDEKIAKERAAVERPSNVDPPPPYIKSEFDGVPMASSAPPLEAGPPLGAYPQQIGFAPPGTYPQLPRQDPVPYSNQPHPPYSNQPQPSPTQNVNVVHVAGLAVGPRPTNVVCPSCKETVITRLTYEAGMKTHLVCFIMCLLQCYCCCCIPYCMDSCQNGVHTCPRCGAYIGTYSG